MVSTNEGDAKLRKRSVIIRLKEDLWGRIVRLVPIFYQDRASASSLQASFNWESACCFRSTLIDSSCNC